MTIKCKFSPLGKPDFEYYTPGTILYEKAATNGSSVKDQIQIYHGVFELMCCSGGGGRYCYLNCQNGAAGSFFKGTVYFDYDQILDIQVGGGSTVSSYNGYPTYITGCINCPGGRSANTYCPGNTSAPTLMNGMQVLDTEICAGGVCNGSSLFSGLTYGAHMKPGYFKLTYLRLEP